MSERLACRVVKQPRGTQRYRPTQRDDEDMLTQAIVTLANRVRWSPHCHQQHCRPDPAALEAYLGMPVINETKIEGPFDADILLTSKNVADVQDACQKELGLDLVKEKRIVKIFTVNPLATTPKDAPSTL
jgi:uncharacterized protein (TIGR03435 family)